MKHIAAICILILASACGCKKTESESDRSEARALFEKLSEMTVNYTTHISNAPDSASWLRIANEYEDSVAKINFSFPPDTDLQLNEGENDTLFYLAKEYIKARDQRIKEILNPIAPQDSTETAGEP